MFYIYIKQTSLYNNYMLLYTSGESHPLESCEKFLIASMFLSAKKSSEYVNFNFPVNYFFRTDTHADKHRFLHYRVGF